MLFNSTAFLFAFLPGSLLGFWVAERLGGRAAARSWLVIASLFFYAYWRLANLPVLLLSLGANWIACSLLLAWRRDPAKRVAAARLRALAIAGNLALLACFKFGGLVLPTGISFFTFTEIALLLDISAGLVERLGFLDFCAFVSFFPQLLAGPIVHHREIGPQLERPETFRLRSSNLAVGSSLFVIGLFKKVMLADGIAASIGAPRGALDPLAAWALTLGYTLHVYFDFSGYADMAIGVARMFGIRLPMNFNSPFKAASFVEFWQRWHITLFRFLMSYVYNPILLYLGRHQSPERRLPFVAPILITMLLSGLWHGAGLQFLAWGLLHGLYLVANNAWRLAAPRASAWLRRSMAAQAVSSVLVVAAVTLANALFRAPDLRSGLAVVGAMLGHASGAARSPLPGALPWWLAVGLLIVWGLPNSCEVLGQYLNEPPSSFVYRLAPPRPLPLRWAPSAGSALVLAALALLALYGIPRANQFVYFAF